MVACLVGCYTAVGCFLGCWLSAEEVGMDGQDDGPGIGILEMDGGKREFLGCDDGGLVVG